MENNDCQWYAFRKMIHNRKSILILLDIYSHPINDGYDMYLKPVKLVNGKNIHSFNELIKEASKGLDIHLDGNKRIMLPNNVLDISKSINSKYFRTKDIIF